MKKQDSETNKVNVTINNPIYIPIDDEDYSSVKHYENLGCLVRTITLNGIRGLYAIMEGMNEEQAILLNRMFGARKRKEARDKKKRKETEGYDGDLEVALIPEEFRQGVLMETADANQVLVENSNSQTGSFALLFEFDGDVRKIRHVMYNCSASRPSIASKTNEEGKEVQTETLTIKSRPLANGLVKAKTGDSTTADVYNNWYAEVYQPVTANAGGKDTSGAEEEESVG